MNWYSFLRQPMSGIIGREWWYFSLGLGLGRANTYLCFCVCSEHRGSVSWRIAWQRTIQERKVMRTRHTMLTACV